MQNEEVTDPSPILTALPEIGSRLDLERLRAYLHELLLWNSLLGLVSKREPEHVAVKLIRLSVDLWDFVANELNLKEFQTPLRVIDIGSGGGFPGIVWKLLNPELSAVLVERKERKAAFLDKVIHRLDLENISVVCADARDLAHQESFQGNFHLVVVIAVSISAKMADTIDALLASPGYFCTVRGPKEKIIEDVIGQGLRIQKAVSLDEGVLVLYRKTAAQSSGER